MRRTYSQEERDKALAVCAELGPYRASKELGIPRRTLAYWAKAAGVCTGNIEKLQAATATREANIANMRAHLKERLLARAVDLEARMDEPHIDFKSAGPLGPMEVTFPKATAQACQQYATAIGILIDKFRLESGEVTSRDEHRNIGESELDRTIAGLLAEMESRDKGSVPEAAQAEREGLLPVTVGGNGNGKKPVESAPTNGKAKSVS